MTRVDDVVAQWIAALERGDFRLAEQLLVIVFAVAEIRSKGART